MRAQAAAAALARGALRAASSFGESTAEEAGAGAKAGTEGWCSLRHGMSFN